jgi:hypothetical protein
LLQSANVIQYCVDATVRTVKDHSTGVRAMIITDIVPAMSGLTGLLIVFDEVKSATQHD